MGHSQGTSVNTQLLLQEYSTLRCLVLTLYEEPKVLGSLAYVLWRENTHLSYDALCDLAGPRKRWPNSVVKEISALMRGGNLLAAADREFPKYLPPLTIDG